MAILSYQRQKMGKWSERPDFIMQFFKDSSKIFVVMTLSIIVVDLLAGI